VRRFHANFSYQAGTWTKPRRVIAKVELQPRQFPAHAGDAGADQGLVADESEGKADQDRREGRQPRRYVIFQMAEVAIPRQMFQEILRLIAELRPQPPPALA
jgi:hypothetical protein